MPIALTCDCGARFEVDDELAGREWPCPDCGTMVRAPARANVAPRFTWVALLAAGLGLMGAFTVVGSLAAALLGLVALVMLWRDREKAAGAQLALAAAAGGAVLAACTLLVWWRPGLLPVAAWLRALARSGQVVTSGPMKVEGPKQGAGLPPAWSLTRPSKEWARALHWPVGDPAVGEVQKGREVVLLHLEERAYADLGQLAGSGARPWSETFYEIARDVTGEARDAPAEGQAENKAQPRTTVQVDENLASTDGARVASTSEGREGREWVADYRRGSLHWKFLIRAYRLPRGAPAEPVYVVRAYCPADSFGRLEGEMRKLLDSVQFGK